MQNMGMEIGDLRLENDQFVNGKWFYVIKDPNSVEVLVIEERFMVRSIKQKEF